VVEVRNTVKIFGVPIDVVTLEDAFNRVKYFLEEKRFSMVFTPNTEIVMIAKKDMELKEVLLSSDMNIPDGIGLIIASRIHNLGLIERVTGVDLMDRMLKFCNFTKKSIFILGGRPGIAEQAARNIKKEYPNIEIKGVAHGYFDEKEEVKIVDRINENKPDILFVGLGAPKQEKWIYKYRNILNAKVAMGIGGSIDIWAGTAKRAPKIFQRLGLEWFYRLIKEPWRIKRMLELPKFLFQVLISRDITK